MWALGRFSRAWMGCPSCTAHWSFSRRSSSSGTEASPVLTLVQAAYTQVFAFSPCRMAFSAFHSEASGRPDWVLLM